VFETLGVLAGAYKLGHPAAFLYHVAERDPSSNALVRVLCRRVKLDSLCPDGYTEAELARPATCPVCRARDPRPRVTKNELKSSY